MQHPLISLISLIPPIATLRRAPLLTALLALAAGCGSDPAAATPPACDAKRAECAINQKVCVEGKSGADATCEGCPSGQYAAESGACEAIAGTPLAHDFSEFSVKAGEEILGLCQSWTLDNDTELWVSTVQLEQDEASHHSNWL
ncbi:MAG: hypothetical protein ABI193_15285, partial [Minicystis sp.]